MTNDKKMQKNNYKIITGAAESQLKKLPDDYVDLTVTSPPYEQVRNYNGFRWNFKKVSHELFRVTKPGGVLVWIVGDQTRNLTESFESFKQAIYFKEEVGFKAHDTMIYERYGPPLTHKRYEQAFEFMFIFVKGKINTFNGIRVPKVATDSKARKKQWHRYADGTYKMNDNNMEGGDRLEYNVWRINMGHVAEEKFAHEHPAIYPEELAYKHIISWSNPGDVILDPFCGSGTTGKLARLLGRKFVGIDISKQYTTLARKRIESNRDKIQCQISL